MKEGTEQTEKVVNLVAAAGNVVDKMKHTEGNIVQKLTRLTEISAELIAMSSLDFAKLKSELKDLDAEERVKLATAFKAKFDIADDGLEAKIEEALAIALDQEAVIERAVAFAKSLKPVS